MSKMKLEENLDKYKWELYEACKAVEKYLDESYPWNMPLKKIACEKIDGVLAKVEKL